MYFMDLTILYCSYDKLPGDMESFKKLSKGLSWLTINSKYQILSTFHFYYYLFFPFVLYKYLNQQ